MCSVALGSASASCSATAGGCSSSPRQPITSAGAVTAASTARSGDGDLVGQVGQRRRRARRAAARPAAPARSARRPGGRAARPGSRPRAASAAVGASSASTASSSAVTRAMRGGRARRRRARRAGRTRAARTGPGVCASSRHSAPAPRLTPERPGGARTRRRRRAGRRRGRRSPSPAGRVGAAVPAELEEDLAAGDAAAQRAGVGDAAAPGRARTTVVGLALAGDQVLQRRRRAASRRSSVGGQAEQWAGRARPGPRGAGHASDLPSGGGGQRKLHHRAAMTRPWPSTASRSAGLHVEQVDRDDAGGDDRKMRDSPSATVPQTSGEQQATAEDGQPAVFDSVPTTGNASARWTRQLQQRRDARAPGRRIDTPGRCSARPARRRSARRVAMRTSLSEAPAARARPVPAGLRQTRLVLLGAACGLLRRGGLLRGRARAGVTVGGGLRRGGLRARVFARHGLGRRVAAGVAG